MISQKKFFFKDFTQYFKNSRYFDWLFCFPVLFNVVYRYIQDNIFTAKPELKFLIACVQSYLKKKKKESVFVTVFCKILAMRGTMILQNILQNDGSFIYLFMELVNTQSAVNGKPLNWISCNTKFCISTILYVEINILNYQNIIYGFRMSLCIDSVS